MSHAGDVLKLIEKLQWPRPIPVTERLPEVNVFVLAFYDPPQRWLAAIYYKNRGKKPPEWVADHLLAVSNRCTPTHWLPMPPAPE